MSVGLISISDSLSITGQQKQQSTALLFCDVSILILLMVLLGMVIIEILTFLCSGATESGELLINAGANVNAKGSNDSTPLILAANGGHVGIAKLLLKQPKVNVHEQVRNYV